LSVLLAGRVCPWGGSIKMLCLGWVIFDPSFPVEANAASSSSSGRVQPGGLLDDVPISVRNTFVEFSDPSRGRILRRVVSDPTDGHVSHNLAGALEDLTVNSPENARDDLMDGRRVRPRNERCYCPVPGCPAADPVRAAGWKNIAAMRSHLEEHAVGRLTGYSGPVAGRPRAWALRGVFQAARAPVRSGLPPVPARAFCASGPVLGETLAARMPDHVRGVHVSCPGQNLRA
jgi:hypothetical protein